MSVPCRSGFSLRIAISGRFSAGHVLRERSGSGVQPWRRTSRPCSTKWLRGHRRLPSSKSFSSSPRHARSPWRRSERPTILPQPMSSTRASDQISESWSDSRGPVSGRTSNVASPTTLVRMRCTPLIRSRREANSWFGSPISVEARTSDPPSGSLESGTRTGTGISSPSFVVSGTRLLERCRPWSRHRSQERPREANTSREAVVRAGSRWPRRGSSGWWTCVAPGPALTTA